MDWGAQEAVHVEQLGRGWLGRALEAAEKGLAEAGFHVVAVELKMANTQTAAYREGELVVRYENAPLVKAACRAGAPCAAPPKARHATITLSCAEWEQAGRPASEARDHCAIVRGIHLAQPD